jgi:hypothetical protein
MGSVAILTILKSSDNSNPGTVDFFVLQLFAPSKTTEKSSKSFDLHFI